MTNFTAGKQISVFTVTGKSWSFVCESMEIALVQGKRRRNALQSFLASQTFATWQEARAAFFVWLAANPRRVVA